MISVIVFHSFSCIMRMQNTLSSLSKVSGLADSQKPDLAKFLKIESDSCLIL